MRRFYQIVTMVVALLFVLAAHANAAWYGCFKWRSGGNCLPYEESNCACDYSQAHGSPAPGCQNDVTYIPVTGWLPLPGGTRLSGTWMFVNDSALCYIVQPCITSYFSGECSENLYDVYNVFVGTIYFDACTYFGQPSSQWQEYSPDATRNLTHPFPYNCWWDDEQGWQNANNEAVHWED